MKCPVCDQENSTMLCTRCGFDASMDYEKYPTFALIGDDIPTKKIRSQEAKKTSRVENDHYLRELIHKCADALVKIDAQQGEIRSLQLRFQNAQESLRKAEQENARLKEENSKLIAEIKSYEDKSVACSLEISKLEQKNTQLIEVNSKLIAEIESYEDKSVARSLEISKLEQKNTQLIEVNSKLIAEIESYEDKSVARSLEMSKLKDELKDTKKYYSGAKEAIQQLRIQENDYKKEISEKSEEINRLQKLLEEEQNKSLLARIFNR